ncbi:MAG TPA: hypothetical protein VN495_00655 [Candidatus Paceibacterota bacterium]|nr:hypothetical protein [Candidatus Paceibacterota bacterium]
MSALRIYVEGQDGAAKTPFCHALVEELRRRGHQVLYCAPFTEVNQALGSNVYHLWPTEYRRAASLILDAVRRARAEVVVFDRGPLTLERGLDDAQGLSSEERAEILAQFPPGKHVFLDTSLERAQAGKRYTASPPPWSLALDQDRRRDLASSYTFAFRAQMGYEDDLRALAAACAEELAL